MPWNWKRPVPRWSLRRKTSQGKKLIDTVQRLLGTPGKLAEMGANAKKLGNPDSLSQITEKLLNLVK